MQNTHGGDCDPKPSSPENMSNSQRLGANYSPPSTPVLEPDFEECSDTPVQSNDGAMTELDRLHDLLEWLNRVDKFVTAQMQSTSANSGAAAAHEARMSTSPPPPAPSVQDHVGKGNFSVVAANAGVDGDCIPELEDHVFRCVLGSDHLPDQHRPVQARLVQASLETDTAPTLVLVVTCSLSRQQLWCSEVAPLLFSDPCAKTCEISFEAKSPRTGRWTLKFDRSESVVCFHSLLRRPQVTALELEEAATHGV